MLTPTWAIPGVNNQWMLTFLAWGKVFIYIYTFFPSKSIYHVSASNAKGGLVFANRWSWLSHGCLWSVRPLSPELPVWLKAAEAVVSQLSLYCSNTGLGIPFLPHPAHSFLPLALLVKLHEELHQGIDLADISHLPFFVGVWFFCLFCFLFFPSWIHF